MSPAALVSGGRHPISRRRALSILGIAAAAPIGASTASDALSQYRWDGQVMGARASIVLYHHDMNRAASIVAKCLDEVERLERSFSLYRADSELARLNRDGHLESPSIDMLAILSEARRWSELSDGAFDVTVQPLFSLYARHFAESPRDCDGPSASRIEEALELVDYRAVAATPGRISLERPGMQLTLNGIGQGYVVDRVAERLRASGLTDILLDLGEIQALGLAAGRHPWRIGLRVPGEAAATLGAVDLADLAIASSGGYGLQFDELGRHHHLLDPRTGRSANHLAGVSVVAARATAADALSTAVAVMPPQRIPGFIEQAGRTGERVSVVAVPHRGQPWMLTADAPARIALAPQRPADCEPSARD